VTTPQLAPPEPIQAPEPVVPVPPDQARDLVKLDANEVEQLDKRVAEFTETLVSADLHSAPFQEKVTAIHQLGNREIREAASVSNRMLDRPVRAMENGIFDDGSTISKGLLDLRRTVEDLDPSKQGDLLSPRKLLGLLPLGNRVRDYFLRYQSAQGHLDQIINTLYDSQDELRKDNAVIEQEKVNLWQLMGRLRQYVYVGQQLDQALVAKATQLDAEDPAKARIVREEMIFYVRQKVQDLLTQLAVSVQGYMALDMIRRNNLELIKGVDRATTTTVAALRTAVMVAQALGNQRLVLDQITALNTTTGNMIAATSEMLKQQTGDIHRQATEATVEVEKLQLAFANIYETMDMISNYKLEALGHMRQTVDALSSEVTKAQAYLDKLQGQEIPELGTGSAEASLVDDGIVSF
jgi:uncharacterized protein YaaN involved in tellurite resistance